MHLFLLTALCLTLFAANSIFCRGALVFFHMGPLQYTALRCLSAALMLSVLCLARVVRSNAPGVGVWRLAAARSSWKAACFLFLYMLAFSLAYMGMPSAAGTLVLNVSVQFSMFGIGVAMGRHPCRRQWLGLCIAVAGLAALVSPGLTAPPLASSLLMVACGLSWGAFSICGRSATAAGAAMAGNFLRCVPMGLAVGLLSLLVEEAPEPPALACVLCAGMIASALGYILWYAIVARLDLFAASVVQLAVPGITALLGILFLGEPVTARLVLCAIPILGGVFLALLHGARAGSGGRAG